MKLRQEIIFESEIAEVQISYSHKIKPSLQVKVLSSSDAYRHVLPLWENIDFRESFAILLLSRAQRVLGLCWISKGGVSGTVVDPKLIFQAALKANASCLLCIHNHPSGQLSASDADIRLTRKLRDGGAFLDITVVDHIIITSESYYSMADDGII
jgi:DNA repair protein RadC